MKTLHERSGKNFEKMLHERYNVRPTDIVYLQLFGYEITQYDAKE